MEQILERKLIRINLSDNTVKCETIDKEDIRLFIGGRGIGNIYMYRELAPGIDPLSTENKLFFCTGPITGTKTPGNGRYIVHTKSPLTGLWNGSLSGGQFGPELRKTGYDMIIVEGKAEKPVYITINNDDVKIKDANFLWGMDALDTQELIKEELHDFKYRIACIGPAGENLVPYAGVINERRTAGRAGAGAVMGSKNLKAIAVRGTNEIKLANPEAFKTAVKHAFENIEARPEVNKLFPIYGTCAAMPALNDGGVTPWRNWQHGGSDRAGGLFPHNWRDEYVKKDVMCSTPCPLMCSQLAVATEGPYAGIMTEGPDYETQYSFGASCDIDEEPAIFAADALCDRMGLDTISAGVCISFVMECFEKGILTKEDTGGDEIVFGNHGILQKLIHDISYRRGFGDFMAMGTKKMSEKLGQGTEAFAMQCKGLELGGYDPRAAKSNALVYAASSRGGCHKSSGACNGQSLGELRSGDKRFLNEGKAQICFNAREHRVTVDSGVLCCFPGISYSFDTLAELFSASSGCEWTAEEIKLAAERACQIERAFNIREGVRRDLDVLPDRLTKESVLSGSSVGSTVELDELLDDFYRLNCWDAATGIPSPERLNELGLAEIAKDMASLK